VVQQRNQAADSRTLHDGHVVRAENPLQRALLDTLLVELFRIERSAIASQRESQRYGSTPPGRALLAIARHAREEVSELEQLAQIDRHRMPKAAAAASQLYTTVRDAVLDRMISVEKSYRGTLIELNHALDLVTLIRYLAKETGDHDLATWSKRWIAERRPLVEAAQRELVWFAQNPAVASSRPSARLLEAAVPKS
jgi:hypothetical protein